MPGPLFGLLLVLSGGALALWAGRIIRRYRLAQKWQKVPAVILKSSLRVSSDSDGTSYIPEFAYSYSVNGVEYQSTAHSHGLPLHGDQEQTNRKLVESLPVGSIVSIAVSPENPALAVLDTGPPEYWIAVRRLCLGIVTAGALILLYAAVRVGA